MEEEKIIFCKSGGCTAKLGAGVLEHILEKLTKGEKDPNLLVGYDSKDDASVYRLTDDLAMVQTLDFFPPVVEDPYTFGKIAAANALSDIYAMGGEVRTALNIVCFPEQMDLNVLGEIMRGGAEKVQEAGGSLSGGHSIADDSVKYGLSVTGTVHPDRIWQNNTGRVGDLLILTKPLGTGILCAAHRVGEENPGGFQKAVESMMTLNKYASETARKYNIHACTDVTGFSFLGHLHEMMESGVSCHIWADQIPVFPGAVEAAEEFLITAAGQRNRNHLEQHVTFKDIPFGMQEVLFDPQTSGGLLMAVDAVDAEKMQRKLLEQGRCGSASQVSDAHGACIRITADLAEGLYLNRARKRYEHRREHIIRGRNKSDDRKDHNFRREKYLPPVQPLCISVMLLEIFCQKYTHRKKEDREEIPKACRKVSFQKVLAHQHNVSRLGI